MKFQAISKILVAIGLVATIILFNFAIQGKESLLKDGQLVLIEMAPLDPRAPMQGDYMSINYKGLSDFSVDSIPRSGYCVLRQAENNVYVPDRFQSEINSVSASEVYIRHTTDRWSIHLGSSSYFFEEGKAALYDSARYAGLRVGPTGKSVLVGLYDKNRELIK